DPESDEIRMLTGKCGRARNIAVFQDAWEQGGDGGSGFTWTPENGYYEASRHMDLAAMPWLRRRLDYIFVSLPDAQPRAVMHVQLEGAWLQDGHGTIGPSGSDYFAVIADLVPHQLY